MGITGKAIILCLSGLWISLDLSQAGITITASTTSLSFILSYAPDLTTDRSPHRNLQDLGIRQNETIAEVTLLEPSSVNNGSSALSPTKSVSTETSTTNRTLNRPPQPNPKPPTDSRGTFIKYIVVPHPKNEKDLKAAIQNATSEAVDEILGGSGSGFVSGGTQIYIIAVIGVLPVAGAALWCLKWTLRKRKKAKAEASGQEGSEPSSTGQPCPALVKSYVKASKPNNSSNNNVKGTLHPPKEYNEDKYLKPSWQQYHQYQQYQQYHQKVARTPSTGSQQGGGGPGKWEFPRSQLHLKEILGEGNFGQVWRAEARKLNGMAGIAIVAVKAVKANATYKEKQDILKEVEIMQKLGRHPNVVTLLGCCTKQEPFYVIMEYVIRGKLLSYLRSHRSNRNYYNCHPTSHSLTSRDLTLFAYQVSQGMEFISSRGIIHRDLATRNVLVDHNQVCKIADFGLARNLRDQNSDIYEQKSRGALPIRWMAPESLYLNVFTSKSDVWAFGILLWEIVTLGSTPYPGMGPREVIHYVREGHVMERPHHCRSELYRVMRSSWSADPKDRPTFSSLKKDLGRLLELQMGYIDLEHFPENCYYNLYQSPGERV